MKNKIIGITGCIGSGKSTVSKILNKHFNVFVVDADKIARHLIDTNKELHGSLIEYFTQSGITNAQKILFNPDNTLNRAIVSRLIFNTHKELKNGFDKRIHPYVSSEIKKIVNTHSEKRTIILDVPIPIESGFFDTANEIWITTAALSIRKKRISERNKNLTNDQIQCRINSQNSQKEYIQICKTHLLPCYEISNNKCISDVENKVIKLFIKLA